MGLYEKGDRLSGLEKVVAWHAQSILSCKGWGAAAKCSIRTLMDQEPNSPPKVACRQPRAPESASDSVDFCSAKSGNAHRSL